MRLISFLLLFPPCLLLGQISFEESRTYVPDHRVFSGLPIAIADLNNDLLDDVITLEEGTTLKVLYQRWNGQHYPRTIAVLDDEPAWSIVVGDLDQNGWKDIVVTSAYEDIFVIYQSRDTFMTTRVHADGLFPQAMNLVDMDNDGWLDLFVCNDIGFNAVLWNEQGQLSLDLSGVFQDLDETDAKGNYGSEWIDFDGDGDQDLYLAKCYAHSDDPTDLKRVNRLYRNEGDRTFIEMGQSAGLDNGAQSWTGQWFDSDLDGDFDLLVTNHDRSAQLYINNGNQVFEDRTLGSGLAIGGPVIQNICRDFDLDGAQDILIGGFPQFLYKNNRRNRYLNQTSKLGLYDMTTMSCGDLNNDDSDDIYSAILEPLNMPGAFQDRVFYNKSEQNRIAIYLQDEVGGAHTVGAVVRLYIGNEVRTHAIKCGESYGIQNSSKLIFGLGNQNLVDSIIVTWPGGEVSKTVDIASNGFVIFHEEGMVVREMDFDWKRKDTICADETVMLVAPDLGDTYIWNGMVDTQTLPVDSQGFYQLDIHFTNGTVRLPGISIFENPAPPIDLVFLQGDTLNCQGTEVVLTSLVDHEVYWSSGNTFINDTITSDGFYTGHLDAKCQSFDLDTVFIKFLKTNSVNVLEKGPFKPIDDAWVVVDQEVNWYNENADLIHVGDSLYLGKINADTSVIFAPVVYGDFGPQTTGLDRNVDASYFHDELLNATMIFDVLRPCILQSVDVYTDTPGRRRIMLYNEQVILTDSISWNLDSGWNKVELEFLLLPSQGEYRMTTDDKLNTQVLGTRSPRLGSTISGVSYPYEAVNTLRIIQAQYGGDEYNYFYNWTVEVNPLECIGPEQYLDIELDSTTQSKNEDRHDISVYPNPGNGTLYIDGLKNGDEWNIYNMMGQHVRVGAAQTLERGVIQLELDMPGVYFLEINGVSRRLIVRGE